MSKPKIRALETGKNKSGPLSKKELQVLREQGHRKGVETLAIELHRSPKQVEQELERLRIDSGPEAGIAVHLKNRPEWKTLRDQLEPDEQAQFLFKWGEYMAQFGGDEVTATEEREIRTLVMFEVMFDREMVLVKEINRDAAQLRKQIVEAQEKLEFGDVELLRRTYNEVQKSLKEAKDRASACQVSTTGILKSLKGTRDQRVKTSTDKTRSVQGLLAALSQEDLRVDYGEEARIRVAAEEKERARLSRPHTYEDGTADQPLLTPETVLAAREAEELR